MRSYKIVRIAKYVKKGKDSIVSIPLEDFRQLVEDDPCLYWYEDVDEYFSNRQKERTNPAYKVACVYNYKPKPKDPDFSATFIEGTDDIIVRIHNNYERSIEKLKEIAEKLDANLYE